MVATVEAMAIENDIKKAPKEILPTSFKFILIHFNVALFNIILFPLIKVLILVIIYIYAMEQNKPV